VLKQQKISTQFLSHATAPSLSQITLKFGLHRSPTHLFLPKFCPKVTHQCWFEHRRHFMANCGRMVRHSTVVTMESLHETNNALSIDTPTQNMEVPQLLSSIFCVKNNTHGNWPHARTHFPDFSFPFPHFSRFSRWVANLYTTDLVIKRTIMNRSSPLRLPADAQQTQITPQDVASVQQCCDLSTAAAAPRQHLAQ